MIQAQPQERDIVERLRSIPDAQARISVQRLAREAAAEITRLRAQPSPREVALEKALRSLVAKLDECEGPITAVCAMAAVRGFPYKGPNYKAEIAAARAALSPASDGREEK